MNPQLSSIQPNPAVRRYKPKLCTTSPSAPPQAIAPNPTVTRYKPKAKTSPSVPPQTAARNTAPPYYPATVSRAFLGLTFYNAPPSITWLTHAIESYPDHIIHSACFIIQTNRAQLRARPDWASVTSSTPSPSTLPPADGSDGYSHGDVKNLKSTSTHDDVGTRRRTLGSHATSEEEKPTLALLARPPGIEDSLVESEYHSVKILFRGALLAAAALDSCCASPSEVSAAPENPQDESIHTNLTFTNTSTNTHTRPRALAADDHEEDDDDDEPYSALDSELQVHEVAERLFTLHTRTILPKPEVAQAFSATLGLYVDAMRSLSDGGATAKLLPPGLGLGMCGDDANRKLPFEQ